MMRSFSSLAAATAFLLSAPAPAAAQGSGGDDPVIRKIWAVGMDGSKVQELSQLLFDSLGPRLMGTPNIKRAQDWLVKTYGSWGITARNEQYGTWRGWRRGHSHIDLVSPRERTLEGTMLGYSPGTGGKDVTASAVVLPHFADSTDFVKWLPAVKGRFVLVSAPLPTCRPREDWTKNATPESAARMDSARAALAREWGGRSVRGTGYSNALGGGELAVRLEQAGAAGVISSRPKDGRGTMEVFETYTTKVPTVGLSCEDYGLVFRLAEKNQGARLRMNLDAELLGEQPVFNTIAMVRGSEKPDEYVMLSAHFDSWDASSGATDNGTGSILMLEAMRILKEAYPHPKRTIIAGHWSGEEEGLVGSRAYSEDHPEIVKGLQAVFNQDGGTGRIQNVTGGGLAKSADHVPLWIARMPAEFRNQLQFTGVGAPSGGGSDGASFSCYGAPSIGIGGVSWDYGNFTWHTDRDTYDKVVIDDLKGNATIVAMLAYAAAEDPTLMSRERVDLVRAAAERAAAAAANPQAAARGGGPTVWPECQKAPRSTSPRLR